jgi:hypothetical protein
MADVNVTILVSDAAVRALKIYTNDGTPLQMKAALEELIDKWGKKYLYDALAKRKMAVQDAIDIDEVKLAAAEAAVGL